MWEVLLETLIALAALASVGLAGYTVYQVMQETEEAPAPGTVCTSAAEESARSVGRHAETLRPFSQPAAKGFNKRAS